MKKIKKIIIGLMFLPALSNAQASMQDLEKISQTYKTTDAYRFDMKYSLFKDHHSNIEIEGFTMTIFKDRQRYYCKRKAGEMLVNDDYTLVLDHDNKVLLIDEYRGGNKTSDKLANEMGLDSLLQLIAIELKKEKKQELSIEQIETGEQEKQYIMHYPEGEYTYVKLNYDASTFLIKKITMYYREKVQLEEGVAETTPRIEITYVHTDLHPEFDKRTFSEKNYVHVKNGGELQLSAGLSNYKVINYLLK